MAGMLLQARKSGMQHLINESNVFDYAPVGCLENTMVGNDRSGTVDLNLNLLKAVELALTGGYDLVPFVDGITGKVDKRERWGIDTGDAADFQTWEQFWEALPEIYLEPILTATMAGRISFCEALAMVLVMTSISSYLAMNFTGSTPFTSPTGVEREMRRAIPAQALGSLCAIVLWVGAPFW